MRILNFKIYLVIFASTLIDYILLNYSLSFQHKVDHFKYLQIYKVKASTVSKV